MKYLQILLIIIIISACSGTKQIITNEPKEASEIKVTDSISEATETVNSIPQTVIFKNDEPKAKEPSNKTETIETFDHSIWNNLLQKNVSLKGNVHYKTFKKDRNELLKYITALSENTPNDTWAKKDKLAFWINAYNALTIDLILRHYPIKSIKDIKDPWGQRYWKLNGKWYNLNEIEHDILRKIDEPRIHFAIVCASISCPKLQNEAFSALNLDSQLTNATKEFLSDSSKNSITENNLELSKIFKWFSSDFTKNGSLINFLNQYSGIIISDDVKKSFKDYNWDLNE